MVRMIWNKILVVMEGARQQVETLEVYKKGTVAALLLNEGSGDDASRRTYEDPENVSTFLHLTSLYYSIDCYNNY